MSGGDRVSQRKKDYFARVKKMLLEYNKAFVVTVDNVGSSHMQSIRKSLRGSGVLLMGKNTLMRKAMREYAKENPKIDQLISRVYGNVGIVFIKGDLSEVKQKLVTNVIGAYAKVGSISPVDVLVPKGDTGMDPSKTAFFQALSIQTKINKGKIEILNDIPLIKTGDKVGSSQAALLQMLNIKPFKYGCTIQVVYDNGLVFSPSVLDTTDAEIIAKFQAGVQRIASVSLATGNPTVASLPHSIANAYQKLAAISLATSYTFKQIEGLKKLLDDPEALKKAQAAAAAPAATSGGGAAVTAAPAAAAKEDKKDDDDVLDEDGGGMGGLFGDD
jgi:large subunit ribosomal protein LP0